MGETTAKLHLVFFGGDPLPWWVGEVLPIRLRNWNYGLFFQECQKQHVVAPIRISLCIQLCINLNGNLVGFVENLRRHCPF